MPAEMPKALQRWETTRQKGKLNFILINGVVCWGLPMFAVMTFALNRNSDRNNSAGMILLSACIWALGGVCFGWTIWTISEKRYQKFLASQKSE